MGPGDYSRWTSSHIQETPDDILDKMIKARDKLMTMPDGPCVEYHSLDCYRGKMRGERCICGGGLDFFFRRPITPESP